MEITDIDVFPLEVPESGPPGENARATAQFTGSPCLIVRIHTDEDLVGLGETSMTMPGNDSFIETIAWVLEKQVKPRLIGEDPRNREKLLRMVADLSKLDGEFTYEKAAIDIALHDILAKQAGIPLYTLLGGRVRENIPVSRSIGRMAPDEAADRAEELVEIGYRLLTVKAGFGAEADIERVAAVREAVGPSVPIEVDPNGAYGTKEAIQTLGVMEREYGVIACEQPNIEWDLDGLARINRAVDMTIAADEPIRQAHDVPAIGCKGAADQITLKLFKQGGLHDSLKIIDTAAAFGMTCNSGSLHPTGVGTSAIRHLCVSRPNVTELGWGYPTAPDRFEFDVIREELTMEDGYVEPPEGPGLGVTLDEDRLHECLLDIDYRSIPAG